MGDIDAIQQLKARYFRTLDTKDWDGLRQVLTDDVVVDTTEAGGSAITGADEFLAYLREALAGTTTVHQGHMPEVTLTSDTTATGVWACTTSSSGRTAHASTASATTTRPTPRSRAPGASRPPG